MIVSPSAETARLYGPAKEFSPQHENSTYPHLEGSAVLYQTYLFTFKESADRHEGIGNIGGAIEQLPYLHDLGIKMIWFTPIYPSPWEDGGYDVSDYTDIHPKFGTLDDFDNLVNKANEMGIGIVMDFTLNHGSTEHRLFQQAISSPDDPAQKHFIFRDPKPDGSPPTNQASIFDGREGSAWTKAPNGKYYFHKFTEAQPDWNLWNPDVHEMFKNDLQFWLNRGVRGFRFDVLHLTYEQLADFAETNPNYHEGRDARIDRWKWYQSYCLHPEVNQLIQQTIVPTLKESGALGIGEINSNDHLLLEMVRRAGVMPFNFTLLEETQSSSTFNAPNIKSKVEASIAALGGNAKDLIMADGNHDNPRRINRIGADNTRLLALLSLSVGGMAVIYNGDEFGMPNGIVPPDRVRDPQYLSGGIPIDRDLARIPLNWDADAPNGGFSSIKDESQTYLPSLTHESRRGRSAAEQMHDPHSMLSLTRKAIELRERYNDSLVRGDYIPLPLTNDDNVYSFIKRGEANPSEQIMVVLNMSDEEQEVELPNGNILLSTHSDIHMPEEKLTLHSREEIWLKIDTSQPVEGLGREVRVG